MNDLSKAYFDFTNHYVEIPKEVLKKYEIYINQFLDDIEKKAAEMEVTCDYYIQEFM